MTFPTGRYRPASPMLSPSPTSVAAMRPLPLALSLLALLPLAAHAGEPVRPKVDSRQCGFSTPYNVLVDTGGVWLYRESPIRRDALVKLFAGVLSKEADGRTYLVTPAEKVDVVVGDAPFLAVDMESRAEGRGQELIFTTNVGDIVACGPRHPLRFALQEPGGGMKPYVLVRGRLEALLTRALAFDLAERAVEEIRDGRPVAGVWSGGAFFPVDAGAVDAG